MGGCEIFITNIELQNRQTYVRNGLGKADAAFGKDGIFRGLVLGISKIENQSVKPIDKSSEVGMTSCLLCHKACKHCYNRGWNPKIIVDMRLENYNLCDLP